MSELEGGIISAEESFYAAGFGETTSASYQLIELLKMYKSSEIRSGFSKSYDELIKKVLMGKQLPSSLRKIPKQP